MDFLKTLLDASSASEKQPGDDRAAELRARIREALQDSTTAPNLGELERAVGSAFDETFTAYRDGGSDTSPGQLADEMEALTDIADAVRAEQDAQAQAKAELDERVNALHARVTRENAQDEDEESAEPEQDDNDGDEQEQDGGQEAPAQAADAPQDPEEGDHQDDEPAADETGAPAEEGRQLVNASRRGGRVNLSSKDINANRPTQKNPASAPLRRYTITAGADVPDTPTGKNLSMLELTESTLARFRQMPLGQPGVGEMRKSIATINREYDPSLVASGQPGNQDDVKLIERVADERRLPGGSVVAAAMKQYEEQQKHGGNLTAALHPLDTPPGDVWCSPSETDWSLAPPLATRTGLLDLPSFQVRRGGVRWPVWKQFPDQRRPPEHVTDDPEKWNEQPQGNYRPPHQPPERGDDYPYDDPEVSKGPRHDWHGYVHANTNAVPGLDPHLEDPDYFVKHPKKFIEGPCVEWAEERMHQSYLWVEGDILREHTFPEVAERFMSDALLSHARFMNETYIRWIVHHSDRLLPFDASRPAWGGPLAGGNMQPGVVPPGPMSYPIPRATNQWYPGSPLDNASWARFAMGSAAEAVYEHIGHFTTWLRNTYRLPFTTSLEGFAPWWFREFLKIDIERKINRPHSYSVSNSDVDAMFAQWGVRLQWVYDWQDMPSGETAAPYDPVHGSHVMPRDGWPNNVDLVLYPAGAWVLAEQNIIRLDALYDSRELRTNKYTQLFMEDGWMLLNRDSRSFVVQLRNLCANGAVGDLRDACAGQSYDPKPPAAMEAQREQANLSDDTKASIAETAPQRVTGTTKSTGSSGSKK